MCLKWIKRDQKPVNVLDVFAKKTSNISIRPAKNESV